MGLLGPEAGDPGLYRGQGDHLPADLGEAFDPPLDGDVALGIQGDDIAGVVPAALRWL